MSNRLEFFDWSCGHHMACPAPIPIRAEDPEGQAMAILQALGAAITQPGSCRARLIDEQRHAYVSYYVTDDHASSEHRDWVPLPVLFCGLADANDRRVIDALTWHMGKPDDTLPDWDGTEGVAGDQSAFTKLPLAEAAKLQNTEGYPPLRVIEVTAELLAAALEDAIDNGIVPELAAQAEGSAA